MINHELNMKLKAVCPIDGFELEGKDENGNITGARIWFSPEATEEQKALAVQILNDNPKTELTSAQDEAKAAVNFARDQKCLQDVVVNIQGTPYSFQADERSQALVTGALLGIVTGICEVPLVWRTSDNINVEITLDDLKAIGSAMIKSVSAAYHDSWAVKSDISKATSPEVISTLIVAEAQNA